MEDLNVFLGLIGLVAAILQIILFFKIWGMTNDVREIKEGVLSFIKEKRRESRRISETNKQNTKETPLPQEIEDEDNPIAKKFLADVYDYITSARKANITNGTISNHVDYMVSQNKDELKSHNFSARKLVDKVYKIIENQ